MREKSILKYLVVIILVFSSYQNTFAQKSVSLNTNVSISVINQIGISFANINLVNRKFLTLSQKLRKRNLLVTYTNNQNSSDSFTEFEQQLNIISRGENLLLSIPQGSEKDLKLVANDELLYLNIINNTNYTYFPQSHFITIVY